MPNLQNLNHSSEHCRRAVQRRWEIHGVPVKQRFWNNVDKGSSKNCWNWKGPPNRWGYGSFSIKGQIHRAHRIAYKLHYGPFNEALCILHKCDNPRCVNPHHLFIGTNAMNVADKMKKGRGRWLAGDDHPRTVYPSALVAQIKAMYKFRTVPARKVAEAFHVPEMAVYKLLNRKG